MQSWQSSFLGLRAIPRDLRDPFVFAAKSATLEASTGVGWIGQVLDFYVFPAPCFEDRQAAVTRH